MLTPLNLPKANLQLKRKGEQVYVRCLSRKKDLLLTPEEWVRQHLINELVKTYNVPIGLIASEYLLDYNGRSKRADLVVFGRDQKPRMIIECKAPEVNLSEETLFQIAQYNYVLGVEYLVMSNGLHHVFCEVDQKTGAVHYLESFPEIAL